VAAPWFLLMQQKLSRVRPLLLRGAALLALRAGRLQQRAAVAGSFPVVLGVLALPWSAWLLSRHARRADAVRARPLVQLGWLWLGLVCCSSRCPVPS
jgi:hypothetical protein